MVASVFAVLALVVAAGSAGATATSDGRGHSGRAVLNVSPASAFRIATTSAACQGRACFKVTVSAHYDYTAEARGRKCPSFLSLTWDGIAIGGTTVEDGKGTCSANARRAVVGPGDRGALVAIGSHRVCAALSGTPPASSTACASFTVLAAPAPTPVATQVNDNPKPPTPRPTSNNDNPAPTPRPTAVDQAPAPTPKATSDNHVPAPTHAATIPPQPGPVGTPAATIPAQPAPIGTAAATIPAQPAPIATPAAVQTPALPAPTAQPAPSEVALIPVPTEPATPAPGEFPAVDATAAFDPFFPSLLLLLLVVVAADIAWVAARARRGW